MLCLEGLRRSNGRLRALASSLKQGAGMSQRHKVGLAVTAEIGSSASRGAHDLNFKVSPEFHRAFKVQASLRGLSMRELLELSFNEYIKRNPAKMPT